MPKRTLTRSSAAAGLVCLLCAPGCGASNAAATPPAPSVASAPAPPPPPAPSAAPAPAVPAEPAAGPSLVVVPMQLGVAQVRGTIDLLADGSVLAGGKAVARITGADFLDKDGKRMVRVHADGTLEVEGGKKARFDEKDAIVTGDGAKLAVGDDGGVDLVMPDGKRDPLSGKMRFAGFVPAARRTACVMALAFFLFEERMDAAGQ
jgi:hypothetical protein